jgi:hypothetical protein
VDISQIIMHEAYKPNAVVDLLDSHSLTGEHGRYVDFFAVHADAAAGGDEGVAVVEGIFQLRQALIGP